MKFYDQFCLRNQRLGFIALLVITALFIGCSQKTSVPEPSQTTPLSGTITEIDDHGNAVTDLEIAPFTERGWKLGDTLEASFATGQKIQIKFVENYGDVPEGEYLGRFRPLRNVSKLRLTWENIAKNLRAE